MHLSRTASRATVAFGLATALSVSLVAPAGAYTPDYEPGPLEIANAELSRQVSAEGMVLLENLDRALPIAPSGNVALFGVGIYRTIPGGTGSGAVNNRVTLTVREGFERAGYAVTTKPAYYDAMVAACANLPAGGAYFGPPRDYSTGEVALTAASAQPTAPTDTAVYVLARNAGETYDRNPGKGDYYLADVERTNIETIARVYPRVIVALNVGGVVDTSFFADVNARVSDPAGGPGLDALLLMSQAGQEAGAALVDILAGGVTPSGKTADTWASSYDLYPAASTFAHADDRDAVPPSWFDPGTPAVNGALVENYSEGIYVGYRYFDSFYKTLMANNPDAAVNYPFGYGLSYTTFDTVVDRVEADMQTVTVEATVVNTGVAFSGKETVQVYFSAPQEGLDKPYQELVGFAKTDVLAPGASQKVTVEFATEELSSYDTARAAYTMQGGDYAIRVGNSSRNTSVAAVLTLGATLVVEQLSHQANDPETDADHPFVELESDPANFYTYPGEAVELRAAPRVPLTTAGFVAPNNASPLEQDKTPVAGSYLAETDGDSISATTAYIPSGQTNWEGTGSPYAAKEGETLQTVAPAPGATLFDVARGTVSMERFVAGLSATQLANIVVGQSGGTPSTLTARGAAGYTTMAYESLGIPAMPLADGPAGVRIDQTASNYVFLPYPPWFESTVLGYQWCTAWPIGTMLAQTWNSELVQQVGEAIGKEMAEYGVTLWLAPGTNLHRDPLNGRNFEYYSEDPLLSGMTAAAETKGVQSTPGVGVTLKHYAANNQETEREASDSVIRERALRELYLKSFEIAVKSAQPMAIMSSYNKVNGHYVAGDYDLLTDVLRGEWGFEGLVMSDWGGVRSGALTNLYSGNDLIVPGGADNVRDVVNLILPTSAVISPANGLPTCNSTTFGAQGTGYVTYSCTLGNIVPDPTGPIQISTWVAGAPASGSNSFTGVQASIDSFAAAADREGVVHWTGAPSGSIVVTALVTDPSGVVTDYRVDIKGVEALPLRLGDLQKSAAAILRIATQSATFAELAQLQSQSGISVSPYTAQFADLKSYVTSSAAAATVPSGPLPIVVEPAVSEPTSGWFTDSANIEIGADDLLAAGLTVRVRIDGGAWTAYSGAIEVTGDGDHTVEVSALDAFAAVVAAGSVNLRIDQTPPSSSADTSVPGRLTLSASDGGSGVAQQEYSVDGGVTWAVYTGPVEIVDAPIYVLHRAVDQAGNVSPVRSVKVAGAPDPVSPGVLASTRPAIAGVPAVGNQLRADAGVWAPGARLTYQWLRGGAPIAGATASVYTPTAADVGLVLSVEVTGSLRGFADVERSSAGVTVAALGRLAAGIPAVVGAARPGLTVTAHPGTWPAGAELSYQWVRSGRDIPGATEHEYVVTAADAGHALAVRVTGALPGWDSAAAVSISVTVEMDGQAAPNTEVRPAGSVAVGSKLSASPFVEPGWTATYQWLRDGQPIVGATEATYAPTKADIGHQVQVVVSKMKVGTDSVTVRSAAVTVPKVVPTVTAKLAVNSVKAGSTPKVRVTVKAKGLKAPTGKLTVKYGSKTKTVVLRAAKKGKITVALPGLAKKGTYKVAVSYGGNATAAAKTAKTVKLTVK